MLLTRGSEVQLLRGTALEMQLDRDLPFSSEEINFLGTAPPFPFPSSPPANSGSSRCGTPFPLPGRLPIPYGDLPLCPFFPTASWIDFPPNLV